MSDLIKRAKHWESGGTVENPKALLRELIAEIESNTTIGGVRQTYRQLYERERGNCIELQGCRTLLADLSRNENGRHEGDADVGDPSGASQGNPHLKTGDVIGYSIHRSWKYVVPEPMLRGDINAWLVKVDPT